MGLKKVSQEAFQKFYEDNVTSTLNRTPKWSDKECSVTWYFRDNRQKACKFVEVSKGVVEHYIVT